MSKVTNKNTRTISVTSFWCLYCYLWTYFTPSLIVSIVDFEQVNVFYKTATQTRWQNWRYQKRLISKEIFFSTPFRSYQKIFQVFSLLYICRIQREPFRGVLRKRYYENMQQIYRRTPIPKWKQLYWNRTWHGSSPINLLHTFLLEHLWRAASEVKKFIEVI